MFRRRDYETSGGEVLVWPRYFTLSNNSGIDMSELRANISGY